MRRTFLFLVYMAVATIVLLEVVVRLWGYSERYIHDPIYMRFPLSDEIPYVHKPNLVAARARGKAVIDTDELGLRVRGGEAHSATKPENEYRIAVVGDSVTFGEGIPRTEDTFVQTLEDALNKRQSAVRVRTFNFGVSAYSVREMTATLRHRVLAIEPDLALMAIIPEDLGLARTPLIDSKGYFVDKRFLSIISQDSQIRHVLRNMHLAYVVRNIMSGKPASGVRAVESLSRGERPESYAYILQFVSMAQAQDLPSALVLLPVVTSRFGRLPDLLDRDRVAFVDLSPVRGEFTSDQFQASRFDAHPSILVHHRIGEALADYVLEHHLRKYVPAAEKGAT